MSVRIGLLASLRSPLSLASLSSRSLRSPLARFARHASSTLMVTVAATPAGAARTPHTYQQHASLARLLRTLRQHCALRKFRSPCLQRRFARLACCSLHSRCLTSSSLRSRLTCWLASHATLLALPAVLASYAATFACCSLLSPSHQQVMLAGFARRACSFSIFLRGHRHGQRRAGFAEWTKHK